MKQLSVTRWAPERVAGPLPRATIEQGTAPEEFMRPEYWAHVAVKMRRFMLFEILDECGEWIAEAYVADCGRTWARIAIKLMTPLSGDAPAMDDPRSGFKVEYRAHQKYRIRRISDNAIIAEGIATKADADRQLGEHVKALAA